ncbi:MAG TPA: ferritin-like protein [Thermoleophilaceae bacterium]
MTTTAKKLKQPVQAQKPITTVEQLHVHLYQAAQVELSTIPLYLYAAYSIQTSGDYQWDPGISAFRTIRSVVIEEMLHLCLVRNIMVATGAPAFSFYDEDFVTKYPSPMLHREPELMLRLEPCTTKLMERVFMPLELPAKTSAPPQPDHYNTLGQFYAAITAGLEKLSGPKLWRNPRGDLQYSTSYWNQDGGGKPVCVLDLPSALAAVATIVEQGEGASPDDPMVPLHPADPQFGYEEYSHYAKFKRIADGNDLIRDLWPVPTDPKAADFDGPVRGLAELFNAAYCYVLCMIDALYTTSAETVQAGKRSPRYGLERTFIAAMGGMLFPIADLLVRQKAKRRGRAHAAPTFEFHRFDARPAKKAQLLGMCDELLGAFPELGGDDGVRALLERLPSV